MTALLSFAPFLALVVAAASTGALFMPGAWYRGLAKPSWTPPDWLFGPAWSVLYLMIAVAGWRVYEAEGFGIALGLWGANLVFNAAWSWLMFGRHDIRLALVDALAMLATIVGFIAVAWDVDRTAALLFAPYMLWVMFASALNADILRRNGLSLVKR